VDCLVEPMCQTRAGDSGSWFNIAPNETKALATALAIRPPIGMIAPSPAPLTPVAVGPRVSRPTCHFLKLTSDLGACIFYRGSPVGPGNGRYQRVFPIAACFSDGPLTDPTADPSGPLMGPAAHAPFASFADRCTSVSDNEYFPV